MGKIIDRIRERNKAVCKLIMMVREAEHLQYMADFRAMQTVKIAEPTKEAAHKDSEGIGPQVAQLTKRVHSLEFQVLRLTPGTREWGEARKEQFESQQRAEAHKILARRAERRAFWGAIARLMGLRRG